MKSWFRPLIGAAIGTLIAWITVPSVNEIFYRALPVDRWFAVGSLRIDNAKVGESLPVRLEQVVKRPFTANWTATLRKKQGNGFAVFCTRHGRGDYQPRTALPRKPDLDWIMNIPVNPPCDEISPGSYVLTVVWLVEVEGRPPKVARVQSNVFEVEA